MGTAMQLEPFSYHLAVADGLQRLRPGHWDRFDREHVGERYQALTRGDLTERTAPVPSDAAGERARALAEAAKGRLGIPAPVTLVEAKGAIPHCGARLAYLPDEIVVVLTGNILEALHDDAQLTAALGREMTRFGLYAGTNGRVHIARSMLGWMVGRDGCPAEMFETMRRFEAATEAYCDLGGLIACESRDALVRMLFKATPGVDAADAEGFLGGSDGNAAEPASHHRGADGDLVSRAGALAAASPGSIGAVRNALEASTAGPSELGALDLIDQERIRAMTRGLVDRVLCNPTCNAPSLLARARELFPGYVVPDVASRLTVPSASLSQSVGDYLAFLLLDLAAAETGTRFRNIIAAAAAAADELGIGGRFRDIARQELRGRRGLHAGLAKRAA